MSSVCPTFFRNHLYSCKNPDLILSSIAFFKSHLRFQQSLNRFWRLHGKDYDGRISTHALKEHLALIYRFLFPFFSQTEITELVTEEIGLLVATDNQQEVLLDQFYELFATLCVFFIETPSVEAAIALLDLLFERTTKLVYRNLRSPEMKQSQVDFHMEVEFFQKEDCEKLIEENERRNRRDDIIYYHETLVINEYLKEQAEKDFEIVSERVLMRTEEVLPMGYSLESILLHLMNENYTVDLVKGKDSRTLLFSEHFTTRAYPFPSSIKLLAHLDEDTVAYLKTFLEHHIYFSCFVLEDKTPKTLDQEAFKFRLSEVVDRKFVFKKLKRKGTENAQFYNIVSAFHKFDDYEIDLIDKLHKEWHDKSEDHMDLSPFPQFESLDPEDARLSAFNLHFLAIKKKLEHLNRSYQELFLESRETSEKMPSLNFHNFVSRSDCLPIDNSDPYIEDLLEYANRAPLQLFVVSKPAVGKTTFCTELAKKLDIIHVEIGIALQRILKKIKDFEESPEMDEEGNPKEFLTALERDIVNELKAGAQVSNESMLELVNQSLDDPQVSLKGFVLDIPCIDAVDFSWVSQILNGNLRIPQINCRYFTHIINLEVSDEETLNFAGKLRENLEDFRLYSEYDRYLLKNPKPKPEGAEDEVPEDEKKPLLDENLMVRPSDTPEFLTPLLEKFAQKTGKKLLNLTSHLTKSQYIDINTAGLPPEQLADISMAYLGESIDPLRPLPIKLDPGSDGNLKELLSQGAEEGRPWRKWSGFYQIDPVELLNSGRVVVGKAEFPVAFAGRVFLFEKEENQLEFMKNPAKYLKNRPKMPKTYNVSICGPHLSGKKTYAELLSRCYGWRIVDVEKIVGEALLAQKNMAMASPSSSAADKIHCSEAEWKEIYKGGCLPARLILPLVLHSQGFQLMKRPPKPPPKEGEEGYEEWKAAEEAAQKEKEKEEAREKPGSKKGPRPQEKKGAKKEEKAEEKEEEVIKEAPAEDLALKDLSLQTDEYGQTRPITGFIFINFPINEEQVQAMKEFNITIDRTIFLLDTNEDETEPGKVLSSRPGFEASYLLENELLFSDTVLKVLQEQLTEEIVKTVSIIGPIEEVFNRIRTIIDPFYVRVDEESNVRTSAEVQEADEPVPFGDFGPYCPVTLSDEGWLVRQKGESTEGLELQVKSRRYIFYTEREMKIFKANVEKYTSQGTNRSVPPPRIMFMGVRGAGLRTQLRLLNEKYKISVFDLKDELLGQLVQNKISRKRNKLLTRSFKPKEVNEEGQEVEDQELNEEAADFDRKAHEISVVSAILTPLKEAFIHGNWFEVEEEQVSTDIFELLQESKRMPEALITLKVKDKSLLGRVFDEGKIRAEYDRLLKELRLKREAEKRAEREKLLENGEEAPPEEDGEPAPIEEDPEAPKLEEMIAEQRDKLLKRREDDLAKIEELSEKFRSANVPVFAIDGDAEIPKVFRQILWELRGFLEDRENLIEKTLVIPVPEEKIPLYKSSFVIKKSRFGDFNAGDQSYLPVTHDWGFMYRERLYFFESEEKRDLIKARPLALLGTAEMPLDINYKPGVFLVGKPKSGVSSLAKQLEKGLGLVRIKVSKILEELGENMSKIGFEALTLLKLGHFPSEEMCVELIAQRIQMRDCIERGWILDSFPNTVKQAGLLAAKGIVPNCVFSVQLPNFEIKRRVNERMREIRLEFESLKIEFLKKRQEEMEENEELKKNRSSTAEYEFEYKKLKLGYDLNLLHQRLQRAELEIVDLENFYLDTYNNVKFLDGTVSKWGLFERARSYVQKTVKQRQMLARSLVLREPCVVGDLALTKNQILEFYSEFKNYCPVAFRAKREFVPLSYRNRFLTFYNFRLYNLSSHSHFLDFKKQPHLYLDKSLLKLHQEMPCHCTPEFWPAKASGLTQEGYDVIELHRKSIKKGRKSLVVEYNKKGYTFVSVANLKQFIRNPGLAAEVKLPVKFLEQKGEQKRENVREKKDSSSSYLENNLANIVMRVMAQLGYNKLKYPTISQQETALKFLALSLKASNPNREEYYRQKYQKKLKEFLNGCNLSQSYYQEHMKREGLKGKDTGEWNDWEEENYLRMAEELDAYLKNIQSKDKTSYFYDYIR